VESDFVLGLCICNNGSGYESEEAQNRPGAFTEEKAIQEPAPLQCHREGYRIREGDARVSLSEKIGRIELFKVIRGDPGTHKISVTMRNMDGARYEAAGVPDAVIGVKFMNGEFGLFFVEVDRATMTTKRWQDKMRVYREYFKSPELPSRFKTDWFIVLTVTTSEKRIMSLAEKTVQVGGKRGFWYTVASEISPGTILGKIWVKAGDLFQRQGEDVRRIARFGDVSRVSIYDSIGS